MATSATFNINGFTFYLHHDGYPSVFFEGSLAEFLERQPVTFA